MAESADVRKRKRRRSTQKSGIRLTGRVMAVSALSAVLLHNMIGGQLVFAQDIGCGDPGPSSSNNGAALVLGGVAAAGIAAVIGGVGGLTAAGAGAAAAGAGAAGAGAAGTGTAAAGVGAAEAGAAGAGAGAAGGAGAVIGASIASGGLLTAIRARPDLKTFTDLADKGGLEQDIATFTKSPQPNPPVSPVDPAEPQPVPPDSPQTEKDKKPERTVTAFVPNNAAFIRYTGAKSEELREAKLNELIQDKQKLSSLLRYHIVQGKWSIEELKSQAAAGGPNGKALQTIDGRTVYARVRDGVLTIQGVPVTESAIPFANGIAYPIGRVLGEGAAN